MGGLVPILNPIGAVAAKQNGIFGKALDPAQFVAAKSNHPAGRALDPINLIRPAPPPGASSTLLADK